MSQLLVLSPKECQDKTWHPPQNLDFAQKRALLPLHAGELAQAAATMPLAIIKEQNEWQLVGVCGFNTQHNLFIKDGQWLGHYQPQELASYPFKILAVGDKGLVVFDQASNLMAEKEVGEPFFNAQEQMTDAVNNRVEALKAIHRKQQITQQALSSLSQANVIMPWPEALQSQLGITIDGLHMIDEKALAQLDEAQFLILRKAQALPIAYAVNFSFPQTHLLSRLKRINPEVTATPEDLESFFSGEKDFDFNF